MIKIPNLLQLVGCAVIFLLVQIVFQIQAFTKEKGTQWNASPRDGNNNAPEGKITGRAQASPMRPSATSAAQSSTLSNNS